MYIQNDLCDLSLDCQKVTRLGYKLIESIKKNEQKDRTNTNKAIADAMIVSVFDLYSTNIQSTYVSDIKNFDYETNNFDEYVIFIILNDGNKKYVYNHFIGALRYDEKKDAVSFCKYMNLISFNYKIRLSQQAIRKTIRKAILKLKPKTREEFKVKQREINTYISFLDIDLPESYKMDKWCKKILHKKGMLCRVNTNG